MDRACVRSHGAKQQHQNSLVDSRSEGSHQLSSNQNASENIQRGQRPVPTQSLPNHWREYDPEIFRGNCQSRAPFHAAGKGNLASEEREDYQEAELAVFENTVGTRGTKDRKSF